MSYEVKPPSGWASFGGGVGKGLSEMIPKEIERYRLASGLKKLSETKNLSPEQYLAQAYSVPGITPAMAEQFGRLAQLRARGENLGGFGTSEQEPKPFPQPFLGNIPKGNQPASVTKEEDVQAIQKGFIPPTQEERYNEAGQLYTKKPEQWGGDPQRALDFVNEKYDILEKRSLAHETRHKKLEDIQRTVKEKLSKYAKDLNVTVPETEYSDIEEQALNAVKKGATEETAMRDYGKKLDEISRQYAALDEIGKYGLITNNRESIASLNNLQKEAKKRGPAAIRSFAESMVDKQGVGYPTAYAQFDKLKDHPETESFIKKLPFNSGAIEGLTRENTERILPELAELIKKEKVSPLTIQYYLNKKNYDSVLLKDYLAKNKEKLELTPFQVDQLSKTTSPINMSDLWLDVWGGI